MWDWVGIAGVLVAAVPLVLTLMRDLSGGKRLEHAMQLRDQTQEGSYARASLDRLIDVEAEAMLMSAVKRRTQIWIAIAYSASVWIAILGAQSWIASQPSALNSSWSGWGIVGGVAAWFVLGIVWTWRQANDVASHKDIRRLRAWRDVRDLH